MNNTGSIQIFTPIIHLDNFCVSFITVVGYANMKLKQVIG